MNLMQLIKIIIIILIIILLSYTVYKLLSQANLKTTAGTQRTLYEYVNQTKNMDAYNDYIFDENSLFKNNSPSSKISERLSKYMDLEENAFQSILSKINDYIKNNVHSITIGRETPDLESKLYVVGDVHGSLLTLVGPLVQANILIPISSSGNYIEYSSVDKRFVYNINQNQNSQNLVIFTGDILERAHHRHNLEMLLMIIDIAEKLPNNVKFLLGNHEVGYLLNEYSWSINKYEIAENVFDKYDFANNEWVNNNLDKLTITTLKHYVDTSETPFIYYSNEYKVLASHTFQYIKKYKVMDDYLEGVTDQPYNTEYSLAHLDVIKKYINYDRTTARESFKSDYVFNQTELLNMIDNLYSESSKIKYSVVNKLLKMLMNECYNAANNLEYYKNRTLNRIEDIFVDKCHAALLSFVWQRPCAGCNKTNKDNVQQYDVDYKYYIVGHTCTDPKSSILFSMPYMLLLNDYSDRNSIYTLKSNWLSIVLKSEQFPGDPEPIISLERNLEEYKLDITNIMYNVIDNMNLTT